MYTVQKIALNVHLIGLRVGWDYNGGREIRQNILEMFPPKKFTPRTGEKHTFNDYKINFSVVVVVLRRKKKKKNANQDVKC